MKNVIQNIVSNQFVNKHRESLIVVGICILVVLLFVNRGDGIDLTSSNQRYVTDSEYVEESYAVETRAAGLSLSKAVSSDFAYPNIPVEPQNEAEYDESIDRQVIKNGSLSLIVKDIDTARISIETEVDKLDGFISHANFYENTHRPYDNQYREVRESVYRSGSLTIRVPADSFDQAMQSFKGFALKVQNENASGNDVTEQYSDLQARITNKEAEEEQYLSLLSRASKIEDILKVTQYLNQTRGEIERMQGQLNRLSNQITLSTITVSLTAEEDIEVFGIVWSPLQEIKAGFQSFLQDMVNIINSLIGFIFALPGIILSLAGYIILAVVVFMIFFKIGKKIKQKVLQK